MDHRFTVDLDAPLERVFPLVADLTSYDRWLDIVHAVEPDRASDTNPGSGPDGVAGAWYVTLRAKIGPFARSKRLRMIRASIDEPKSVRFERAELDGRDHAPWVLEAVLEPVAERTALTMALSYGGRLWTGALAGILDAQVTTAAARLEALAADEPDQGV